MKSDKVSFFAKVIYEKIEEEHKKELSMFEAEQEKRISEFETASKEKRKRRLAKAEEGASLRANEMVSNEKAISRREIMMLVEEFIRKIIISLESEFDRFAEGPEYKDFLIELVERSKAALGNKDYRLYMTERDIERYRTDIEYALGDDYRDRIEICASPKPIIGGVVFEEKNKEFDIDNSFHSQIHDSRSYIGFRVTEALKVGGENSWNLSEEV